MVCSVVCKTRTYLYAHLYRVSLVISGTPSILQTHPAWSLVRRLAVRLLRDSQKSASPGTRRTHSRRSSCKCSAPVKSR